MEESITIYPNYFMESHQLWFAYMLIPRPIKRAMGMQCADGLSLDHMLYSYSPGIYAFNKLSMFF